MSLVGSVAQLVEQRPEEPCVDGSSPPGTTIFCDIIYMLMRLVVDKFKIVTKKKLERPLKFVVISDIHLSGDVFLMNNFNIHSTVNGIKRLKNVDAFVLCGDFTNIAKDILTKSVYRTFEYFLKELTKIAPVLIVRGNHDFVGASEKSEEAFLRLCKLRKVSLLDNKQLEFQGISITGFVPDNETYGFKIKSKKKLSKIAAKNLSEQNFSFDKEKFNLIITHSPLMLTSPFIMEMMPEFFKKIDLIFSGHLHNGMATSGNIEFIKRKINQMEITNGLKKFLIRNIDLGFWVDVNTGFKSNYCRGAKIISDGKSERTILPSSKDYEKIYLNRTDKHTMAQLTSKGINKFSVVPVVMGRPSVLEVIIINE